MKEIITTYSTRDKNTKELYGITLIKGETPKNNMIHMEYRSEVGRLGGVLQGEKSSRSEIEVEACMDYLDALANKGDNANKDIYKIAYNHIKYNKMYNYQQLVKRCQEKIKEMQRKSEEPSL